MLPGIVFICYNTRAQLLLGMLFILLGVIMPVQSLMGITLVKMLMELLMELLWELMLVLL